jgi:hypothetical protein
MYFYDGFSSSFHRGRNDLSRHSKFIFLAYAILSGSYLIFVAAKAKLYKVPVSFSEWLLSLLYASTFFLGLQNLSQMYKFRRLRVFEGVSYAAIILEALGGFSLIFYAICDGAINYHYTFLESISHRILACLLSALTITFDVVLLTQSTKYPLFDTNLDKMIDFLYAQQVQNQLNSSQENEQFSVDKNPFTIKT